jgi:hypothetical protein
MPDLEEGDLAIAEVSLLFAMWRDAEFLGMKLVGAA